MLNVTSCTKMHCYNQSQDGWFEHTSPGKDQVGYLGRNLEVGHWRVVLTHWREHVGQNVLAARVTATGQGIC